MALAFMLLSLHQNMKHDDGFMMWPTNTRILSRQTETPLSRCKASIGIVTASPVQEVSLGGCVKVANSVYLHGGHACNVLTCIRLLSLVLSALPTVMLVLDAFFGLLKDLIGEASTPQQ